MEWGLRRSLGGTSSPLPTLPRPTRVAHCVQPTPCPECMWFAGVAGCCCVYGASTSLATNLNSLPRMVLPGMPVCRSVPHVRSVPPASLGPANDMSPGIQPCWASHLPLPPSRGTAFLRELRRGRAHRVRDRERPSSPGTTLPRRAQCYTHSPTPSRVPRVASLPSSTSF